MASFSWPGFGGLVDYLGRLARPDPTPMLEEWEDIIDEDNRRGVMAGIDCNDEPMPAVRYRPKPPGPKKTTRKQRNNVKAGARGVFAGMGPFPAGLNNNLTPDEYKLLGGPPLAPRGENSRVITNLLTQHTWDPDTAEGYAEGRWFDVVSVEGKQFLDAHFEGKATGGWWKGTLPKRDLRGVRAWGRNEAVAAMRRWAARLLKGR